MEPRPGERYARHVIESAPGHPGLVALAFPWEGSEAFSSLMDRSRFFAPLLAVCRDLDGGRVSLTTAGRVRIDYRVSSRDAVTLRAALGTMARVALAAGATEMVALGTPPRWYRRAGAAPDSSDPASPGNDPAPDSSDPASPGADPAFTTYLASLTSWDPGPGRGMVLSAHQMGTARAGADAATHPCDPDGRVRAGGRVGDGIVAGLYVADASLFPTAAGINPMITTMLLARRVARTVMAESGTGR